KTKLREVVAKIGLATSLTPFSTTFSSFYPSNPSPKPAPCRSDGADSGPPSPISTSPPSTKILIIIIFPRASSVQPLGREFTRSGSTKMSGDDYATSEGEERWMTASTVATEESDGGGPD
ncbi:hypothetical protein U1Q18_050867, partial [Sarracenia purpurea var. burkii]